MCFGKPFDGVYLAFSDSSSVGRTTTAIAVIEGVTGSSPVYPITTNQVSYRKAQALVPVCCFVNKAIIRKAGNKHAIRK